MTLLLRPLRPWCLFTLALFADASDSPSAGQAAEPPRAPRITVLGDSLSVSPSRPDSFPSRLQARLVEEGLSSWTVINAGMHGDTTGGGLRRVDSMLADGPAILVLALGANDGLQGIPTANVRANLSTIMSRARAKGVQVLLCGMETPPLRGWSYTLEFHHVFPQLAREHDVPLVPFLLAGVVGVRELNGDDLIHPNAKGAKRMAETVWPYLERLVRTESVARAAPVPRAGGR